MRIKQLTVKGYPKIKDTPALTFGDNGLLICAENTGHNRSIIQLICDTLADQSGQSGSFGNNPQPDSIEIIFTDNKSEWAIGTNNADEDNDAAGIKKAFNCENFSIKADTIKKFVSFAPEDRYAAVAEMINLNAYSYFETMLEVITAPLMRKQMSAAAEMKSIKKSLSELFDKQELLEKQDYISEISLMLNALGLKNIFTASQIAKSIEEIEEVTNALTLSDDYVNLTAFDSYLNESSLFGEIWDMWSAYSCAWERLHTLELETKGLIFDELLTHGLECVETHNLDSCPLCQGRIDTAALKDDIQARLSYNRDLLTARTDFKCAQDAFFEKLCDFTEILFDINSRCVKLNIANPLAELTLKCTKASEMIHAGHINNQFVAVFENVTAGDFNEAIAVLKDGIDCAKRTLIDKDRLAGLKEAAVILQKAEKMFADLDKLERDYQEIEANLLKHRKLIEHAANAKKKVVEKLINSIAPEADGYFNQIYSVEEEKKGRNKKNTFLFHPNTSATLHSIGRQNDMPVEYDTDSHLSTLALCVFLAIRRMSYSASAKMPLMFIDKAFDVTDGSKKERIAELIFSWFSDHQLIIATADLDWMKRLAEARTRASRKMMMKFDSLNLYTQFKNTV